jgi:hypothetical protein
MRTAESTRPSFQYDGIDFEFDEEDHDWVQTAAQQFARSVIDSIDRRMPENPIMAALQMFDVCEMPSSDTDWTKIAHEYGSTSRMVRIQGSALRGKEEELIK